MKNLERYKGDLKDLIKRGGLMSEDLSLRNSSGRYNEEEDKETEEILNKIKWTFEASYQSWYTESISVIRQLTPDRLDEFVNLYEPDPKRKSVDVMTYTIQDWLNNIRSGVKDWDGTKYFNDFVRLHSSFRLQLEILKSSQKRFKSSLFNIQQLVEADILDSEIEVSKELLKKGFFRAAGVICGVVLEKHLGQVCNNHQITIRKSNPTIANYLEVLKTNDVIEISVWRQIQHLADIRNKCGHDKGTEPLKEEIEDIVRGTERIIKTVF